MAKKKESNIFAKLSRNAKESVVRASLLAKEKGKKEVDPNDIFAAILMNREYLATRVFISMEIDPSKVLNSIGIKSSEFIDLASIFDKNISTKLNSLNLSEESRDIVSMAYQIANRYDHVYVGTEHLILAILSRNDLAVSKRLEKLGVEFEEYLKALATYANYPVGLLAKPSGKMPGGTGGSLLREIGKDLVMMARRGKFDPVIGRDEEIDKVVNILSRRKKNNPIVVGEAGVGKTALVEGLAQRIADGLVPNSLADFRIISIDIPSIMAGSKMRGDVEQKMIQLVSEVSKSKNVILFIDEIQNIFVSSIPGGTSEISTVLKPALVTQNFRCIGTTTSEDYTKYFEEDSALNRRFQPVQIEEPSIKETIAILAQIKPVLEKHHNMKISEEALIGAAKLSDRFVSNRFLPDKAIDLLDEATATRRLEVESKYSDVVGVKKDMAIAGQKKKLAVRRGEFEVAKEYKDLEEVLKQKVAKMASDQAKAQKESKYEVDLDTIKSIVAKWTGIPVATIDQEESDLLQELDKSLSEKVIGQDEAVTAVSYAIKRARAGISDPGRPWASLLFLGPTGVGKTQLAKVLTEELFGTEKRLIQIDMSELMEQHSVSKLIGSPPGYIGYREGGQLTEAVSRYPYSVILFDEIEKAHPNVLNILLQILEYGHLTDAKGKRVNFKNTIIIMTSNIGAEEIGKDKILGFIEDKDEAISKVKTSRETRSQKDIENAYESMKSELVSELKDTLRPELLNRLDDIVIFRALTKRDARQIVGLLVDELNERLVEQNVKVSLDRKAVNYVVKEGFNEEYGARPLRRVLQDEVESLLADLILEKKSEIEKKKGLYDVEFTVEDEKLSISG
ncbi:AAA domain-containing protein [Candidatus Dojkabacteria bacterium]|nr:AAA domain-containing protein [Candidatus Dojkabacteria bacterium]